ncbi:MAG: hypothetical protein AAFY48_16105 [Bacteroidota bacterium]
MLAKRLIIVSILTLLALPVVTAQTDQITMVVKAGHIIYPERKEVVAHY